MAAQHIALPCLLARCCCRVLLCMLAMSLAGVVSATLSVAGRVDMNQKLNYFQPHDGKIFCSNKQLQQGNRNSNSSSSSSYSNSNCNNNNKAGQHKSLADILTQLAKIVQPFGCVAKRLQSNRQHIYSQFVSKPLPPPHPLSHSSFHLRCPQRYYTWICVHVATAYPTALRDPKCHKYSRIAVANEILPANIAIYSGQQGELCT